jgi:hypothetical protein
MGRRGLVDIAAFVQHETEKAWLLDVGEEKPVWVAKSQVEDNRDGTFTMPVWLARDKGLI